MYCRRPAEQGDVGMMFEAAERYKTGKGLGINPEKAVRFYQLAKDA